MIQKRNTKKYTISNPQRIFSMVEKMCGLQGIYQLNFFKRKSLGGYKNFLNSLILVKNF